ncbi:hypothetical protein MPH_01577 [Macrophomina phaseolina MS6]|uniref:Uncharacterized protein n=1 Tax=Macrophomina phaseolina (strain MS6) TaxID=1126212 RepID=K2S851_MACPH|nr:hypothetical protein MPH_01577 [Macrophomina phaseolina MS6]
MKQFGSFVPFLIESRVKLPPLSFSTSTETQLSAVPFALPPTRYLSSRSGYCWYMYLVCSLMSWTVSGTLEWRRYQFAGIRSAPVSYFEVSVITGERAEEAYPGCIPIWIPGHTIEGFQSFAVQATRGLGGAMVGEEVRDEKVCGRTHHGVERSQEHCRVVLNAVQRAIEPVVCDDLQVVISLIIRHVGLSVVKNFEGIAVQVDSIGILRVV